ncbi:hypothetical protein EGR_02688 [Echinococcus granulosus]|uniref:Uncharacterized protein n=1 Tax=Echinococcus granulosus TaxID=6210 RepID=W6UP69_ECHGR|nr:hypothetical protein EGR_02688 [Echinococcus granulosus]EUB62556.1 hypothetical protein EGR_02688 [Echinococcus granulosus]
MKQCSFLNKYNYMRSFAYAYCPPLKGNLHTEKASTDIINWDMIVILHSQIHKSKEKFLKYDNFALCKGLSAPLKVGKKWRRVFLQPQALLSNRQSNGLGIGMLKAPIKKGLGNGSQLQVNWVIIILDHSRRKSIYEVRHEGKILSFCLICLRDKWVWRKVTTNYQDKTKIGADAIKRSALRKKNRKSVAEIYAETRLLSPICETVTPIILKQNFSSLSKVNQAVSFDKKALRTINSNKSSSNLHQINGNRSVKIGENCPIGKIPVDFFVKVDQDHLIVIKKNQGRSLYDAAFFP